VSLPESPRHRPRWGHSPLYEVGIYADIRAQARHQFPEEREEVTDSSNRTEGDLADAPDSPEGTWRKRYDGLQRVLGQRTNDLDEARRIAQEATQRAESAESAARDYRQLYDALYAPDEPAPPAPIQADEPDPSVDANNPRKQAIPRPEPTIKDLEREAGNQLARHLANRF
jgi:hypothetical protein